VARGRRKEGEEREALTGGAREPEREGRRHDSGWPMEAGEAADVDGRWAVGPQGKEGEEGRAEGKERGKWAFGFFSLISFSFLFQANSILFEFK
jgi:hypothetical protein